MPEMTEILIKVRGSSSVELPPEIGVAHAEIWSAGASPEVAMDRVQRDLARMRQKLERLQEDGVVDRFVVQQVRTSVGPDHEVDDDRPWREEEESPAIVHRASVWLRAEFVDFDALAVWVGRSATEDGCLVNGLSWQLRTESRRAVEREVRQDAVRDARVRAQDYADALDLGTLSVRSINDVGVGRDIRLQSGFSSGPEMASATYSAPELAFTPDDITVFAEVEAAFTVGP